MRFNPTHINHGRISAATAAEIEAEPMLFNADHAFVAEHAGPLTCRVLDRIAELGVNLTAQRISVDTRSHMLMRGWFPAIPGWHHDDVDRKGGQPYYSGDWFNSKRRMFCVALDAGTGSLPEWVAEPVDLQWPLPEDEPVYRYWDQQLCVDNVRTAAYESGTLIEFDQRSLHRATPATGSGWRWFARVTLNPGPRPDAPKVRAQTQVYLPAITKGW